MLSNHITKLVDTQFSKFPLYCSKLRVLRRIYIHYRTLLQHSPSSSTTSTKHEARILRQALKLLVLVHIGGDIMIDRLFPIVQEIMTDLIPGSVDMEATPCFIRGQLGAVIPSLAEELMKSALRGLEKLALSRVCSQWPTIVSVTAVLLMAIESIQYHSLKTPYHASLTPGGQAEKNRTICATMDTTGVEALLNFYRVCYGSCHSRLSDSPAESLGVFNDNGVQDRFTRGLKSSVDDAKDYLERKSTADPLGSEDMSVLFDRLLAKLFLAQG